MPVKTAILGLIEEKTHGSVPVTENTNLYTDLCFDSLAFVALLAEIEDAFSVSFGIAEMESCLQVSRLIEITAMKVKERGDGNDQAFAGKP